MKGPAAQLARMLAYILGRRPDEFGLVTDLQGFVKIKDLLKALNEEEGLRHVRRGNLEEIIVAMPDAPIEIQENRIRAKDRTHLTLQAPADTLPKLLFTCVRRKAYPVVLERGISPGGFPLVVLSSEKEMALRIGRRSDGAPVLLTVSVQQSREAQVRFLSAGGSLFLSEEIPPGCFTGPPLRRVHEEMPVPGPKTSKPAPKQPGSVFPDPADIISGNGRDKKDRKGKGPDWKRGRKRMQRLERKKGPRF
jgi:putative RNA 2'-phosphotransferase